MCGVAGVIRLDGQPVQRSLLKSMTDAIAHRGPDGEGHWVENSVGIGHRRLAIIDLSDAGHQPMVDKTSRFVLSYNGEIYNHTELRRELESLGHRFRGKSDSEVVLNAFFEWGVAAFQKFNGMFAIAVWDRRDQVLTMARDRYGIKPLYYAHQGQEFLFASEQKAILSSPRFSRKLNRGALLEYFTFQNIFTDQTLLDDIFLLKAGHFMELGVSATGIRYQKESRYWDFLFSEPSGKVDSAAYSEELARLLAQSVDRQLVSDVEVGAYLSGGMDSGSVVAFASSRVQNLKTFTVGFDLSSAAGAELDFDERVRSESMSSFFRTDHFETIIRHGDMEESLADLAWHLEEPRVGQSYPNYYAAKLAGSFVKVVLSGVGGDELFGGYPWRYFSYASPTNLEEYVDAYYRYWQRLIDNREIRQLFDPIWEDVRGVWTRDIFKSVFENYETEPQSPNDYVNRSLYFEAKTFLHGLLVVEDKISMAHGLETRLPMLDNDLVDFAMACPANLKVKLPQTGVRVDENLETSKEQVFRDMGGEGKLVLRAAMQPFLPQGVAQRKKQGFSSPDASWFRNESILFVKDRVLGRSARSQSFFNMTFVRSLLAQHFTGQRNLRLFVWALLNFEAWLERFLPTSREEAS